jgi:hypothetical protein
MENMDHAIHVTHVENPPTNIVVSFFRLGPMITLTFGRQIFRLVSE